MASLPKQRLTPEQYLEIERRADHKSEYHSGEMFALAGVSEPHALIMGNIFAELHQQLKHRPCKVYQSEMRVKVDATGLYTYPDVTVVCGEARFDDNHMDTLLNPTVLIEVLSKSTEAYDRGEKYAHYRRLESVTDYLMVSQHTPRIEQYVRQPDGHWLMTEASGLESFIEIASIDCRLALSDVYDKVDFSAGAGEASTPGR